MFYKEKLNLLFQILEILKKFQSLKRPQTFKDLKTQKLIDRKPKKKTLLHCSSLKN